MTPKPTADQLKRGQCPGYSYDRRLWPCSKKPVRDGYCGTHHPDAERKREAKMAERIKKETDKMRERISAAKEHNRRALAYPKLMARIKELEAKLAPTQSDRPAQGEKGRA